jgi:hypothetical protein
MRRRRSYIRSKGGCGLEFWRTNKVRAKAKLEVGLAPVDEAAPPALVDEDPFLFLVKVASSSAAKI